MGHLPHQDSTPSPTQHPQGDIWGPKTGRVILDTRWTAEDCLLHDPPRISEVRTGHILPSHLAGTTNMGEELPASRTQTPGTSQASKSKTLGQDMQHKGSPCVYFGGFIGGGGVMLAAHPAVWKREGPGAVSDLIPQTWRGLPSSEMSP